MKLPRLRALVVQEVVQTASMDCGPAALKAMLAGHHLFADYESLREACHTSVDGTSIEALERLATEHGLDCEQLLVPTNHLLAPEAGVLPAIVVTRLVSGATHFVLAWRRLGPFLQIMDPQIGRRWVRQESFLREVYDAIYGIEPVDWEEYARSPAFLLPLQTRLESLGLASRRAQSLVEQATRPEGWYTIASLDAVVRLLEQIHRELRTGRRPIGEIVESLFQQVIHLDESSAHAVVPERFWSAGMHLLAAEGQFSVRGAVALHGERSPLKRAPRHAAPARQPLPPRASTSATAHLLARLYREDDFLVAAVLSLLAGPAMIGQILVIRVIVESGHQLAVGHQRLGAIVFLLMTHVLTMVIDYGALLANGRLGRALEFQLRQEFFEKLPRVPESYFRSRSSSDVIERAHALRAVGTFPHALGGAVRSISTLLMTGGAIVWIAPDMMALTVTAVLAGIAIPLAGRRALREREVSTRTHSLSLVRLYLDTILGSTVVRAQGAERNVERLHEELLGPWVSALARSQKLNVLLDVLGSVAGLILVAVALWGHLEGKAALGGNRLLLAFWLVQLPGLSHGVMQAFAQLPAVENTASRLFDVLDAREVTASVAPDPPADLAGGMTIKAEGVWVEAAGQPVLRGIDLEVRAGEHVAVVGVSGSGKSSLVSLLLGLIEPAQGHLEIDGQRIVGTAFERVRRQTAWVAPESQLWRGTILDNVTYGAQDRVALAGKAIHDVEMDGVISHLPAGLQSLLGESGTGLSGGESQRLRLARGRLRDHARLVLLDEAFRGLPRGQRQSYLESARKLWSRATLLATIHDIDDTTSFDRVIMLAEGRIVEQGAPGDLLVTKDSLYSRLVHEAAHTRENLVKSARWRVVTVRNGHIHEGKA